MKYDRIGIVIADDCEFEPLRDFAERVGCEKVRLGGMECVRFERNGALVSAVLCGVGKVNAASAAAFLIADGAKLLINTGYSGGINRIARGQTTLVTRFVEHDFDLTPLGYRPAEKPAQQWIYDADAYANSVAKRLFPQLVEGVAVCGDCFVSDDDKRARLKSLFDAVSCDMESAAVASVGFKAGVGTLALRRISDDTGDNASGVYREEISVIGTSMTDMVIAVIDAL